MYVCMCFDRRDLPSLQNSRHLVFVSVSVTIKANALQQPASKWIKLCSSEEVLKVFERNVSRKKSDFLHFGLRKFLVFFHFGLWIFLMFYYGLWIFFRFFFSFILGKFLILFEFFQLFLRILNMKYFFK